ncbi:MAG: PAS domain-containing protein, partial [Polyangiaceae bacterium]|nr:PAS domain-containing protein [Polyangiaceae bacterium]
EWVEAHPFLRHGDFFGIPTVYYWARPEPGVLVVQITGLAAFAESLRMVVQHLRSGDPRARPLAGATLFMTVTIAHDLHADYTGGGIYFLLPYGILGAIIAMAYILSGDVLRTAIAEDALRQSEERFKIAVEGTSDGLFDWNLLTGEAYYSARFAEILGIPPARLEGVGRLPFRQVDVREREAIETAVDAAIASGAHLDVEAELGSAPQPRWVRLRGQAVLVDGKPSRFAGAISDVTERRNAEVRLRESQKLESVGRLAGGVAHDFNNMLAGVIAFADLIRREQNVTPRVRAAAGHIIDAGQRAAELTARLLSFSRQTTGVATNVDAHRAIEEALSLLERTVDRRIHIERDLRAERHVVRGDAAQIQSAVLNLGVNARDAMRDGGILRISTRNEALSAERRRELGFAASSDRALVIRVADTGSGIAPEHVGRVFEPFYTTKAIGEGTGLGLAAVRATIDETGGAIALETELGRGTTVDLYFPVSERASETE